MEGERERMSMRYKSDRKNEAEKDRKKRERERERASLGSYQSLLVAFPITFEGPFASIHFSEKSGM